MPVDSASNDDVSSVVVVQSVWRGRQDRRAFERRHSAAVEAREARYRFADLLDAAIVIQRLMRRFRRRREARLNGDVLKSARASIVALPANTNTNTYADTSPAPGGSSGGGTANAAASAPAKPTHAHHQSSSSGGGPSSSLASARGGESPTPSPGRHGRLTPIGSTTATTKSNGKTPSKGSPSPAPAATPSSSPSVVGVRGAGGAASLPPLRGRHSTSTGAVLQTEVFSLDDVDPRLLRLDRPPADDEILALFEAVAITDNTSSDASGSSLVVPERLLREMFFYYGGEALLLEGETLESASRALILRIARPTLRTPPRPAESINLNFDQFCRFLYKVIGQ